MYVMILVLLLMMVMCYADCCDAWSCQSLSSSLSSSYIMRELLDRVCLLLVAPGNPLLLALLLP